MARRSISAADRTPPAAPGPVMDERARLGAMFDAHHNLVWRTLCRALWWAFNAGRTEHAASAAMSGEVLAGEQPRAAMRAPAPGAARAPDARGSSDDEALLHRAPVAARVRGAPASIQEELALLDRARLAVRAHDVPAALSLLDDHAQRFARGAFQPEAQVLRIQAFAARGETQPVQTLGRSFLLQYPGHPLAARVSQLMMRR